MLFRSQGTVKQKKTYIRGIIYMVSFMLPCISWPEAFMLMWVEMNMVTTARMGKICLLYTS